MCLCVYIGTNQNLETGKFIQDETLLYLEKTNRRRTK